MRLRFRWQWLLLRFHVVGVEADSHDLDAVEEDVQVVLHDVELGDGHAAKAFRFELKLSPLVSGDGIIEFADAFFEFVVFFDHAGLVIVFHYCLLS